MIEENLICDCSIVDAKKVKKAKKKLGELSVYFDLAELFKVFADTTRLKILTVLLHQELCVCDIANTLDMTQSAISHQLRTLKSARLVKLRKVGKMAFYSLDDDHVNIIMEIGLEHLLEKRPAK